MCSCVNNIRTHECVYSIPHTRLNIWGVGFISPKITYRLLLSDTRHYSYLNHFMTLSDLYLDYYNIIEWQILNYSNMNYQWWAVQNLNTILKSNIIDACFIIWFECYPLHFACIFAQHQTLNLKLNQFIEYNNNWLTSWVSNLMSIYMFKRNVDMCYHSRKPLKK